MKIGDMDSYSEHTSHCRGAGREEGPSNQGSILYLKKGQDGRKSEVGREEHLRVKRLLRKTMELVG